MREERRPPRLLHRAAYTFPFPPTSQEQASSHKQKPTGASTSPHQQASNERTNSSKKKE